MATTPTITQEQPQPRQPRNIFEQLVFGLQTVNDNIVDLYRMVGEIHSALYPVDINSTAEPTDSGAATNNE